MQAHYQARVRIAELSAQLNDVAHQYRMVEKRLLVRYKDRNPTPLGGLDALMTETYDKLISISKNIFLFFQYCICMRVLCLCVYMMRHKPVVCFISNFACVLLLVYKDQLLFWKLSFTPATTFVFF